jgi:nicotinamide-nucleotide amidase
VEALLPIAERAGALLKARGETVAVAESSAGGLVCAALLAVPGASAYFRGGVVAYTRDARRALLGIADAALDGVPPNSEPLASLLAGAARDRLGAAWGLGETGAAGPTGNRYGHPAGRACLAVAGPIGPRSVTLESGSADRRANMRLFGAELLRLLVDALEDA